MSTKRSALFLACAALLAAEDVKVPGVEKRVEILRDRWGVPHIYASTVHDLFFAQGYITARDRLFQIDLWRRAGTGKLAEVLGPSALERDRLARSVNFRGDWNAEWAAYGDGAKAITTAFTDGINAYIKGLGGKWSREFQLAGYGPGLWTPEDCVSRLAGLTMTRNLNLELTHALDIQRMGIEAARKTIRLEPAVPLEVPAGLDLGALSTDILRAYRETVGPVRLTTEQGSNNWVVDGTMTATGRPTLANDPHRPVQLNFRQTNGASWRQVLDVGDWDRSVMTNVPGESGDPSSKHYSDLLQDWAAGRYHPMPFSRKAVESTTEERIILLP